MLVSFWLGQYPTAPCTRAVSVMLPDVGPTTQAYVKKNKQSTTVLIREGFQNRFFKCTTQNHNVCFSFTLGAL